MNTYTCPICGKKYTSATAMANCVAECAKNEDYKKALTAADEELISAKEQLEKAIEEYNSVSKDYEYSLILNKKLKKGGCATGGITRVNPFLSAADQRAKESDLESFLKGACGIKPTATFPNSAQATKATATFPKSNADIKAEKLFAEFNDLAVKCAKACEAEGGDGGLDEFLEKFKELKEDFYESETEADKMEKIAAMEQALGFIKFIMVLGGVN